MRFGGSDRAAPRGEQPLAERRSYFIGANPAAWRTGIPVWGRVRVAGVYPGVDAVFYGRQGKLEYDLVVAPGGDPARIRLLYEGVERLEVEPSGDLVLVTAAGRLRQHRPFVYEEVAGRRRAIAGRYELVGGGAVGFRLGRYDHGATVVIDPVLTFVTYLGGSGLDAAYAVATDAAGNVYVTGETQSSGFPSAGAVQGRWAGSRDVFVTKLDPAGATALYSTFLGGSGSDSGRGIAVDGSGNASVTGTTYSTNFPVTPGGLRTSKLGLSDAFVAKLNADGSALVYSTYLGGGGDDAGAAIAVDAAGNATVAGYTNSLNFPVTAAAAQSTFQGGAFDGFAARLNVAGSALDAATYLGGGGTDSATGVAIDQYANAYVTGQTDSVNFPTASAYQAARAGGVDVFVAKVNAGMTGLVYSTYLGGTGAEQAGGIVVDSSGSAVVAGATASTNFPVTPGAYQTVNRGSYDAFLTRLSPAGNLLPYSTLIGGSGSDAAWAVALDPWGNAWIAGMTDSTSFPALAPLQARYGGGRDAFVTQFSAGGSLLFSSWLGGSGEERGYAIAIDPNGIAAVAGQTFSTDLVATSGALKTRLAGSGDAFVMRAGPNRTPQAISVTPASGTGGAATFSFAYGDPNGTSDLSWVKVLINSALVGASSCDLHYDVATRNLTLLTDTTGVWLGPVVVGTAGTVQNSQCSVDAGASSVTRSATTLTLSLAITFKTAFAGAKNVYMFAQDKAGVGTGWQTMGAWTVLAAAQAPPVAVSVTPSSGTGSAGTFTFVYSDLNGASDLVWAKVLINSVLAGLNSCDLHYDAASHTLTMLNDSTSAWLGPVTIGSPGTLQNSQCAINAGASSVTGSGTTLTLSLAITFGSGFRGSKNVYMFAQDQAAQGTGWQLRGAWTVP
jgi:hypothetical protein